MLTREQCREMNEPYDLFPVEDIQNLSQGKKETLLSINNLSRSYGHVFGIYSQRLVNEILSNDFIGLSHGKYNPEFGTFEHSHMFGIDSILFEEKHIDVKIVSRLYFMHKDCPYIHNLTIQTQPMSEFISTVKKIVMDISNRKSSEFYRFKLDHLNDCYLTLFQKMNMFLNSCEGDSVLKQHRNDILKYINQKEILKEHRKCGPIPYGLR